MLHAVYRTENLAEAYQTCSKDSKTLMVINSQKEAMLLTNMFQTLAENVTAMHVGFSSLINNNTFLAVDGKDSVSSSLNIQMYVK